MAAASYTTDLTDFETFQNGASTVTEVSGYTATSKFEDLDGDNPIQGTLHASAEQRSANTGSIVVNGTATTLAAGEAFFIWQNFLQAGAVNTFALEGIVGIVGTGTGDYYRWTVGGSDFGRNPYGGWANIVCDPTITTGRTPVGSPGTSYSIVGYGCDVITAISKGSPYNLDAIRSGRGEVIVTDGDLANGYATFEGIATQNDLLANRWGLFQDQFGTYLWKGLLSLGTTTSVDFRDANRVIVIDNTIVVGSSFNRIEVNNAASNIDWDAINISALGTVSRGQFEMIDGATLDFNTCVFTDMDTFIFNKGTGKCDLINSTWRRCSTVTSGGATFTSCTFDNSTSASSLVVTALTQVVDCVFESDGSNHAVELTGAVPSAYTWDHETTGYVPGSEADFIGGTNPNATIYINPSVADSTNITITVPTGVTLPSIRFGTNYTGTVTVERQGKTIDVNVTDEDGNPVSGARVYINDGTTTIFNGTTDVNGDIPQQSYSGTSNSTLRVRQFGKVPFETTLGTAAGNVSQLVTVLTDDQQIAVPTLNNTWSIDLTLKTVTMTSGPTLPFSAYSAIDTAQDLYEFVMNLFAGPTGIEFPVALESVTRTQYNFINGYTFGAKDNDHKFIYDGSFTDSANNLLWSNVKSIGSLQSGTGIYIVQGTEAADAALTSWWPDGNIDVLIKVQDGTFIQSTDDTATNVDGAVWIFAREYGDLYDHFFADLSNGGQNIVALSTLTDLNNQTASGTVATYTDITLTFGSLTRDIGDGNGLQPYAAEVNCNGRPLDEVYEYLKYITSFDFSQTVNGDDGYEYRNADEANFSNVDNKQAPFGTFAGGRFFGAQGVFLTNMASADSTNFELIDSNGVLRFPPLTVSFELTGLKDGTEVRIYNASDTSDIAGVETITAGSGTGATTGVTITGTTNDSTFAYQYTYSIDINIIVVVVNLNFQNIYLEGLTLTNTNQSIPIAQVIDRQYLNP